MAKVYLVTAYSSLTDTVRIEEYEFIRKNAKSYIVQVAGYEKILRETPERHFFMVPEEAAKFAREHMESRIKFHEEKIAALKARISKPIGVYSNPHEKMDHKTIEFD